MAYEEFRGVHTALITPFTGAGEVDEAALSRLVEYQIGNGVRGLVPCGTTGESPTLTHPEHDRVIELTIEYAAGRVPVIAGTGSNATSEAIRLSLHAEQAGADAVLLVNPYYNKPTQKGLYLHFKAIAGAVSIPCILYNIKGRTGINLETDTLAALAHDCPNIIAVKEASGDLDQIKAVIARRPRDFRVLSGDDNMVLDLVEAGGDGVISVASNLFPRLMSTMVAQALSGKKEASRDIGTRLDEFFHSCFLETNPIPIKTAMAMCGWCEEEFRLPMCTLEKEEHRTRLTAALEALRSVAPEAFLV